MVWKKAKFPVKNTLINSKNTQELITGGGKKQVPCLRIEQQNGSVTWLYESSDIIHYIKKRIADQ